MQISRICFPHINSNSRPNKQYTSFNGVIIKNISQQLTKPRFLPKLTIVDVFDAITLSAAFGLVYALLKNAGLK